MIDTLFDDNPPTIPMHRRHDPMTSRIAARRQTPEKLARGQWLALDALERHGPLTDHELADITGIIATSIGKRRTDLTRRGWVRATDERRPSPSGSPCTVWSITSEGHVAWSELAARQDDDAS